VVAEADKCSSLNRLQTAPRGEALPPWTTSQSAAGWRRLQLALSDSAHDVLCCSAVRSARGE